MADTTDGVGINVSYVYQHTMMLAVEGETLKDIVYKAKVDLKFKLLCKIKEFTRLGNTDHLGEKRTEASKI